MKKLLPLLIVIAAGVGYYFYTRPPSALVLTGIVTTHDVVVAPQLGGPSLGGVCISLLGAVPTLLVNSASYLVSAVLLRRLPERHVPSPDRPPMRAMIREGWEFVTRHPQGDPAREEVTVPVASGPLPLALSWVAEDEA